MSMEVYLINPNSENADMAITFLEFVAQHMKDSMEITLCPDANDPVEDPDALRSIGECKNPWRICKQSWRQPMSLKSVIWKTPSRCISNPWCPWEDHKIHLSSDDIAMYREVEPYIYVSTSSIYANIIHGWRPAASAVHGWPNVL